MAVRPGALVVDPDQDSAKRLCELLHSENIESLVCSTAERAFELLNAHPIEVLLSEIVLPDATASELIACCGERWPGMPVIVFGAEVSALDAVTAFKAGAAEFLEKPFHRDQVAYVVQKALSLIRNSALRPPLPPASARARILGDSPAMQQACETLRRAAEGNATVLVRGETGTGKELIARAVHDASNRAARPFVKIDCASLPENLLESELFGYERGAFTGAVSRKLGRVELAHGGSLFLDEIGELGLTLQAKLLRLLQDREFERLGGTKTQSVDIRVIAATHRDLESMVERGEFRTDLFYRLNVVPLWVPPLRARREDIELLTNHFCASFAAANGKSVPTIDSGAMRVLRTQRWPGNVRQLQNFVERLVALAGTPHISEEQVRSELDRQVTFKTQPITNIGTPVSAALSPASQAEVPILPLDAELMAAERAALERALAHCRGNRSLAARLLGISRTTLYAKLSEHGLA